MKARDVERECIDCIYSGIFRSGKGSFWGEKLNFVSFNSLPHKSPHTTSDAHLRITCVKLSFLLGSDRKKRNFGCTKYTRYTVVYTAEVKRYYRVATPTVLLLLCAHCARVAYRVLLALIKMSRIYDHHRYKEDEEEAMDSIPGSSSGQSVT